MDKRIREAAENDLHSYEEKSWPKMEGLLDKHLPQEKRRRRFIFFLLLFLGLGAASIFLITQTSTNNNPVAEQKNAPVPANTDAPAKEKVSTADNDNVSSAQVKTPSAQTDNNLLNNNDQEKELSSDKKSLAPVNSPDDQTKSAAVVSEKTIPLKKERNQPTARPSENKFAEQPVVSSQKENNNKPEKDKKSDEKNIPLSPVTDMTSAGNTDVPSTISTDATTKNVETEKNTQQQAKTDATAVNEKTADTDNRQDDNSEAVASSQPDKKEKTKTQKGNKLILSFSAGPDISFVSAEAGTMKMQYGVSVGYTISDRFTVRTGFYAGRKIYTADSNSYHTPFNTIGYNNKLDRVDANCLVYEIPITVVYNFTKSKNHNWFVSTGLSSYIMKSEEYLCTYKDPWGQEQQHDYSYTKNSHLFSILSLSGGYQYHFNNRLSLMAEPYLKLPLTGVGYGKVNLNSAGLLFTLGYKPFLRSK